uniref:Gypsy retrotransposon integrase-like protein 1 n=1 Tax=Pseudonaja textilis TaxID=8673 RepID=A0A670ZB52_PSETE
SLLQSNVTLQNQVTQLLNYVSSLSSPAAVPPAPPVRKSPVSMPEKFSEQMDRFPAFMGQCQLFISLRPEDFPTDRSKVGFMISLLTGQAANWATPLLVQDSPLLNNFQGFLQQMRVMFENPIKIQTVDRRLRDINQGKRSLQEYIAEFRLLCMDSNWNEPAHMAAFQEGLSDAIKDELVHAEGALTLDALIVQCLRIEARLYQRGRKRLVMEPSSFSRAQPTPPRVFQPTVNAEEPMELGALRPRLTVENEGIPAVALVDSGATTSFMDCAFVKHFGIPLIPVNPPIKVETVDGRELKSGPICCATQPVRMLIGDHEEAISFYVTSNLHLPLVLGMSWLCLHDPLVAWSQNAISFPSLQCVDHLRHVCAGQDIAAPAVSIPSELSDFSDVFSEQEADRLPPHCTYDCPLDLIPDAPLPKGRLYSMSEPELVALREFLDKNLARGFIRSSSSPLSAPVLFVKKKSGELHLCCDYRCLNSLTVRNSYPLPLIPELMERLQEATIFTKLDLRGVYNLVRMRKGDEWKMAFGTRYGHFEYTVMPFGLTNAPAVFQHLMNDIFRDMLDRFVVVYLDDILIYSRSWDHHLHQVRQVLQRLREHKLYAKLEKCFFFQSSIEFLGHIISPEGIAMDPKKVEALCSWEAPRRVKDVQHLLGFTNYYQTFILDFAKVMDPITQLLRKKVPFVWGGLQQQAFDILKKAFVAEPILRHPDPNRPFVVETDASNVAIGAVLLQASKDGAPLFPCAYYSRKLTASERNYTIWEKELLAIKAAFETWRHHLEWARHKVEVRTDHRNLEHLTTAKKLNQCQIRWSLFFARFNFSVTYVPSGQNRRADALSQKPEYIGPKDPLSLRTVLPPESLAILQDPVDLRARIREAQRLDAWTQQRQGDVGPDSPWSIEEDLLRHRGLLYVPTRSLRALIMTQCHDNPAAGHFGFYKTLHLVTRTFWWPQVHHDVFSYVASCVQCRQAKAASGAPPGLLQPLLTLGRPWGMISMDFLMHLPSSSGFTTVLVIVDMLTKMAHFIPCQRLPSSRSTAQLFLQHIFRLHGLPDRVVSDRGVQFTVQFWKQLMAEQNDYLSEDVRARSSETGDLLPGLVCRTE